MSKTLHALYPALKADYERLDRAKIEAVIMYWEKEDHYPNVSFLVSWGAFAPHDYPFARQRSLQDEGLVVCAAYQELQRRSERLGQAYRECENKVQHEHRKKVVCEAWKNGDVSPHPLLGAIDALDENEDLLVGYVYMSGSGETFRYRGLTKSQCPLLTEGLRLLFKSRGHPRIELASQEANGFMGGIIPGLFADTRGVDDIVDKFRTGKLIGRSSSCMQRLRWGQYLFGEQELEAIGKLDKYLSFPNKGMPEPSWYDQPVYDEIGLQRSWHGWLPEGDYGPLYALCFAYMMGKDERYGEAFKDVFVAYVHYAMFWRWKVAGHADWPREGKRPLFTFVD